MQKSRNIQTNFNAHTKKMDAKNENVFVGSQSHHIRRSGWKYIEPYKLVPIMSSSEMSKRSRRRRRWWRTAITTTKKQGFGYRLCVPLAEYVYCIRLKRFKVNEIEMDRFFFFFALLWYASVCKRLLALLVDLPHYSTSDAFEWILIFPPQIKAWTTTIAHSSFVFNICSDGVAW